MNVILAAPFWQAMIFWIVVGSTIGCDVWLWVFWVRHMNLVQPPISYRTTFLILIVPAVTGVPVVYLVDYFYRALERKTIGEAVWFYYLFVAVAFFVWCIFAWCMQSWDKTTVAFGNSKIVPKEQKAEEALKEHPSEEEKNSTETIPPTTE